MENSVAMHVVDSFKHLVHVILDSWLGQVVPSALNGFIHIHVHELKYEGQSARRFITILEAKRTVKTSCNNNIERPEIFRKQIQHFLAKCLNRTTWTACSIFRSLYISFHALTRGPREGWLYWDAVTTSSMLEFLASYWPRKNEFFIISLGRCLRRKWLKLKTNVCPFLLSISISRDSDKRWAHLPDRCYKSVLSCT